MSACVANSEIAPSTFSGNESLLLKLSTETGSLVRIFRSWFLQLLLIAVDLKERLQVNKHQMENVGHH